MTDSLATLKVLLVALGLSTHTPVKCPPTGFDLVAKPWRMDTCTIFQELKSLSARRWDWQPVETRWE